MGRLRAYFDQLAHPMQDVHSGTITRAYCRAIYEESASRCFILPPLAGEVRRSRIGGGERSEPISKMLIMSYDSESKSRNAEFISIAYGNPPPSAPQALSPPERSDAQRTHFEGAERRTKCSESFSLWDATLLHNPRRQPRSLF